MKFLILYLACVTAWAGSAFAASPFRAGAFSIDVTPTQFPTQLSGGILPVISTNVLDPLHARCLVLDNGQTQIGICILDNCLFQREFGDEARGLISRRTGIPVTRLTVACTHNHSSPALMPCHGTITDTNYARWLLPRLADGMQQAMNRLEPARVGWAVTQAWDYSFNRRWVRRPDQIVIDPFGEKTARVQMNPGHESPDVIGPAGPKDPDLSLLAIETRDGQPLCVLANFANHYFGVSGPVVSSDYFSRFGERLGDLLFEQSKQPAAEKANRRRDFVGIMSQGTSGDINRFNFAAPRSSITLDQYAQEMAQLVFHAYQKIQFHDWVPLAMRDRNLHFATRYPDAKRLAWARDVMGRLRGRAPRNISEVYALQQLWLHENRRRMASVQALRIGDLGIVSASAEVYAISGLKIKAQSPLQPVFWITLANGNDGYIPPPPHFQLGGYTTWPTRTSSLETNAEPIIVENLLEMLEEVSGKRRNIPILSHGPYAQAVLASRPYAYWRLEEMDGTQLRDSTHNNRPASVSGGICHFVPGAEPIPGFTTVKPLVPNGFSGNEINRAFHLVEGRVTADLNVGGTFSVELWFWNGLSNDFRGVTAELLRLGQEQVGISGTNQTRGALFYSNEVNQFESASAISFRRWHHLVWVSDRNDRRLFLNGQLIGQTESPQRSPSTSRKLIIGGVDFPLEGKIDEIAVYPRALAQSEIARHFALAGFEP